MLALLSKYWWVLVIRGVMAIALGVFAFVWPQETIAALVVVFGASPWWTAPSPSWRRLPDMP